MHYLCQPADTGKPLRSILRGPMQISYTAMKSAKWAGRILLNGQPVTVDTPVQAGDGIDFCEETVKVSPALRPYELSLDVIWEDEHLAVVNKPAPLASQCGHDSDSMTLENVWFSRCGCPEDFIFRPVNRLDKGTSGLMVIAKTAHAQDRLQRMLHSDAFTREYLAVTEGIPDKEAGTIDLPIAKEDAATVRRVIAGNGKPALTEYRVLQATDRRALLRLRLHTGRTHQIRVHLSAIGCPICGDFLYGTELPELPRRFALHSAFLRLQHPFTDEQLNLEAPLPDALTALLRPNIPLISS